MTARRSGGLIALLLGLSLAASGCATTSGGGEMPAASIPVQQWRPAGTWYGSALEVGATSTYYGSTLTLRFDEDGTWSAAEHQGRHTRGLSGRAAIRGNQLFLTDSTGRYFLRLTRVGDRLYGLYHDGSSGHIAIELRRRTYGR